MIMKYLISILFVFFLLFVNISDVLAEQFDKNLKTNISDNNNVSKDINSKKNYDNPSSDYINEDIFGDEQAFPFIAGLGKNAAH